MNAAVFLDRDNTLIHNDGDLGDPELVKLVQGASSAIASLRGLGYKIVVVSNQGGVARGSYAESDVDAVNQRIADLVKATSGATIDRFYYCPYHPEAKVERYKREHPWRKPNPGMILQAAQDLNIDLAQSWTIGDQMRDAEAGTAAGTRTILLHDDAQEMAPLRITEQAERRVESGAATTPNHTARNLIEAVRIIAQQRKPESPEEVRARQQMARRQESLRAAARIPDAPPATATAAPPPPAAPPVPQPYPPSTTTRSAIAAEGASAVPTLRIPTSEPESTAPLQPGVSPFPILGDTPEALSRDTETLRQILQELRHQRGGVSDFSFVKGIAVVLQLVVVSCFAGAIFMGAAEDSAFIRWILAGILLQLATIATLMFSK